MQIKLFGYLITITAMDDPTDTRTQFQKDKEKYISKQERMRQYLAGEIKGSKWEIDGLQSALDENYYEAYFT